MALEPQGAFGVEGSLGRECSPGSPRLIRPRTPQLTASLPPCAPPSPRTPAPHRRVFIHALAGCRAGRAAGPESWGPSDSKFVLQTQRSPSPNPTLRPAPGASPGFAASLWPPRAARPKVRDSRLWRLVSRTRERVFGQRGGGWRVSFSGKKALLGLGPVVRRVQTCCSGVTHLILEVADTGDWKGVDISDQSHLGTKLGPGRPWRSDFQAIAEDVPRGVQMAGAEAAELRALALKSTRARTGSALPVQPSNFSPSRPGGGFSPLCPGGDLNGAAPLDP